MIPMTSVNTTTANPVCLCPHSYWGVIAAVQHHVSFLGLRQYYTLRLQDGTCLKTGSCTVNISLKELPFAAPGDRVYYSLDNGRLTTIYVYLDKVDA